MAKNRYVFLDGLRGVAAIFVFMFHSPYLWGFRLPHGHLAVDLFFSLSGYVIGHAYDQKIATGSLPARRFMWARFVRLYPIYALSALLCIPIYLITARYSPPAQGINTQGLYLAVGLALAFIPFRMGGPFLFGVNVPYWSLLFELIVNLLYVIGHPFLSHKALRVIVIGSGVILAAGAIRSGSADFGSLGQVLSALGGLCRAVFGFSVGLLLYRYSEPIRNSPIGRMSPWITFVPVIAVLALPSVPHFDVGIDLLAVFIIFPLCVAIGSSRREPRFTSILLALGSSSYPLYAIHFPIVTMVSVLFGAKAGGVAPAYGLALLALVVALSIALEKVYDLPVRRWLLARGPWRKKPDLAIPLSL